MVTIAQSRSRVSVHTRAPFLSWLMLWAGGLLAIAFLVYLGWEVNFRGRIYPGVVVGEVSVGGQTLSEAARTLKVSYPPAPSPPIEIVWGEQRWLLPARLLTTRYETTAALTRAYEKGRAGGLTEQLLEQGQTALLGARVAISAQTSPNSARAWLNALSSHIYRPLREPSMILDAHGLHYRPGAPGREVDVYATWARLERVLQARRRGQILTPPVTLVVRQNAPTTLDVKSLESTLQRLTRPIILEAGAHTLSLDPAVISRVITVTPRRDENGQVRARIQVDSARLRQAIQALADRYDVAPSDARMDYDPANDRFIVLRPSRDGWQIDVEGATRAVSRALQQGKTRVVIPTRVVHPAVSSDMTPAQLGIRTIIGEGSTYFRGSSAARVRNIVRAAKAVRGVLIPPGDVFSFNEAAGAITAANGYEDSLIIWGDRTAVGIGGGVCQVSTTLFRAAFFGGFPIVERWNHGYIVSWYGEPGLDATVYSPSVDFKFKNTTTGYVLVQPLVDTKRGVLTFRLWGTDPGWTVEVGKPVREDVQKPPPPAYQEDPSLPTGTIRQVEWAKPGMVVRVRRIVRKGDKVLDDQEFVSRYQPWRALYLYGPGTKVPKSKASGSGG